MAEPLVFRGLLPAGWRDLEFRPFREGIEHFPLREGEPAVSLLRYAPGARVPEHVHTGMETILVIEGEQSDERGTYGVGTLVLNAQGTAHSVWSRTGCVVLVQWNRPVEFLS